MANAWLLRPLPAVVTATAGTLQLGAPENTLNDYAGVVYQAACSTGNSARTTYDLGGATDVDTVMVFGVGVLPVEGTLNARFYDAGGASIGFASVPAYAGGTVNAAGLGISIASLGAPVAARTVRLDYVATGAGQAVRFARVVIGKRFVPERNFSYGASVGVRDLGSLDFSPRGVLLRRRGAKLRTVSLGFPNMRKDEVEGVTRPLLEYLGNTEMVALLTDPAADAQIASRAYFGPLVGDLAHVRRNAVAYEAKLNLVSIFN